MFNLLNNIKEFCMNYKKKWNELTKLERIATMDFALTLIKLEKSNTMDVVHDAINKELKRIDSLERYNSYIPLLFRDEFNISATIDYVDMRYICRDISDEKNSDITTVIFLLLSQCKMNFNEKILNYNEFDSIVRLINDVNSRELSSGMISYNKKRAIPKSVSDWL